MAVDQYIPAPRPSTAILRPSEILEVAQKRVAAYGARNALYALYAAYYDGKGGEAQGGITASNARGKPIMREAFGSRSMSTGESYNSNRLAPVVDDYQALIGRVPNVRVEAPNASDEGEAMAERLTKYLYSTYDLSDMERQQAHAGHWLSSLGDVAYVQEVDFERSRTVVSSVDPRLCYPSFGRGPNRFRVRDMVIASDWSVEDLRAEFGDLYPNLNASDTRTVYVYLSRWQRTVLIPDEEAAKVLAHVEWMLDYCPAQWVFNKGNGVMAQSDIGQSLSQQDFLDFANNVWADALVHMVYPIVELKGDPSELPEGDIEIGPGATVPTGIHGGIVIHAPQHNPQALEMVMQQTLQDLNATTGSSEVRQEGQVHGSIITGRAIQSMQGPQGTRLDLKRQVLGAALRDANSSLLCMQEKAPLIGDKQIEINGRFKGKSFRESMRGKEIDGWYRNQVTFDELVSLNPQQRLSLAFEGMQSMLWDDLTARDVAGIEDPLGMRDRIEAQKVWEAALQQKAQAAAQGGGGNPNAQMAINSNGDTATPAMSFKPGAPPPLMRPPQLMNQTPGQIPPGPPAPPGAALPPGAMPPGGMPPSMPPPALPGGVPQGASRKAVAAELAALKLKGQAFALGDLAMKGQAQKLHVGITDHRDHSKVVAALKKFDAKPNVKKHEPHEMPAGAVRIV